MIYYIIKRFWRFLMKNYTIWFTGLYNSGKTTLSNMLFNYLNKIHNVEILDSDVYRKLFNNQFSFTKTDRILNIRSLGVQSYYLNRNNINTIVAVISPYKEIRELNRQLINQIGCNYIEIYCKCDLDILNKRSIKTMYSEKDNTNEITYKYEEPDEGECITVNTGLHDIKTCFFNIILNLNLKGILPPACLQGIING